MKKKKLWIDIDGVLRELDIPIACENRNSWTSKVGSESISEYIDRRLDILISSPTTIYFPTICDFVRNDDCVNIITCQLKNWRKYTVKWLNHHFKKYNIKRYNIQFVDKIAEKEYHIGRDEIIIEDYPFFSEKMKDKIILIDRPYNKEATNHLIRVYNPKQLRKALTDYVGKEV